MRIWPAALAAVSLAGCAAPDEPRVTVWAISPPDATPARARRIADALGLLEAAIVERADAVVAVPTGLVAGPARLRSTRGSIALGHLRAEPGRELELAGSVDAGGSLVAGSLASPPLVAATTGGEITGVLALARPATATIALGASPDEADVLGVVLPLELTASCAGSGCFRGTCTIPLAVSTAPDSYDRVRGTARIAATLAAEPVSAWRCSADSDPQRTALLLDIASGGSLDVDVVVDPVPQRAGAPIVIDRATGVVSYTAELPLVDEPLPSPGAARATADALLASLELVPTNARVTVTPDDREVAVRYEPMLPVDAAGLDFAPVRDAAVVVRVGPRGWIAGLEARWRPAVPATEAALRSDADARAALAATAEDARTPELAELPFERAYTAVGPGAAPAFYDLVWRVTFAAPPGPGLRHAARGEDRVIAPATRFMPLIAELDVPDDLSAVDATRPIRLGLALEAGTPPYAIRWASDLDGDLGDGAAIAPELRAGRHEIRVTIADAAGAGFAFVLPLQAVGPHDEVPLPRGPRTRARETIKVGETRRFGFGGGFEAGIKADKNDHAPEVSVTLPNGKVALELLTMQRWRYRMQVKVADKVYAIRSGFCFGYSVPVAACAPLDKPLAEWTAAPGEIVAEVADDKITFIKPWGVKNLPGDLTLAAHYQFGKYYCGPSYGELPWFKRLGGKLAGIRREELLGGECPGFRPEITWAYDPPMGGMTPRQLKSFCLNARGQPRRDGNTPICDIPLDVLQNVERLCETVPIESFAIHMYTLVRPHGPKHRAMKLALVKDKDGEEAALAKTDGAVNRSAKPIGAPNEAFVTVNGIAKERTASFVKDGKPDEWDNFHAKEGFRDVTFPGCNDRRQVADINGCLHFHERWVDEKASIDGRDDKAGGRGGKTRLAVTGYIVLDRGDEVFGEGDPLRFVNDEKLLNADDKDLTGFDDLIWLVGEDGPYPEGVAQDGKRLSGGYLHAPIFFTY